MASYGAPSTPEAHSHKSAKGDESHSYSSPMPMVFENSRSRSPRQHYVWSEKALSIVRSTRIPKKDGAWVVQQLQALTGYPEKPCWRLAERYGFRRPNARRVWSRVRAGLMNIVKNLSKLTGTKPVLSAAFISNSTKSFGIVLLL